MADVIRTIGATTGESSTMQAAVTWLNANYTLGTDDIGYLRVVDSQNFDEELTISGFSGTASAVSYVQLETTAGVRHSGVEGTGHARMATSKSTKNRVITVGTAFTRIVGLEIYSTSAGDSDEGIRFLNTAGSSSVDSCIVHGGRVTANQDGLYGGAYALSEIKVTNCIIYDWTRGTINAQVYSGSSTQTWTLNYCLLEEGGGSGEAESGLVSFPSSSGATVVYNIKNTASMNTNGGYTDYTEVGSGTHTWNGSNNIASDTSCESKFTGSFDSVVLTNNNSATGEVYTVANVATNDFTSEENDGSGTDRIAGAGVAVSGITTDILGNTRHATTPDIGPFELQAAAGLNIAATLATLTLTDNNVTLNRTRNIAATSPSLTMTGNNANVSFGLGLNTNLATLTLGANNVTSNMTRDLAATLATLTIGANASTVARTREIAGTLGTLTLGTNNGTVNRTRNLAGTLATLNIAPLNAVIQAGNDLTILGTLATLTMTGNNVTLNRTRNIAGTLGTLSIASNNATVDLNTTRNITATAVSLNLVAINPVVTGPDVAFYGQFATAQDWFQRRRKLIRRKRHPKGWDV